MMIMILMVMKLMVISDDFVILWLSFKFMMYTDFFSLIFFHVLMNVIIFLNTIYDMQTPSGKQFLGLFDAAQNRDTQQLCVGVEKHGQLSFLVHQKTHCRYMVLKSSPIDCERGPL